MINKNFYPTPQHLIDKMLEGVRLDYKTTILEPSAGKGDIVDRLKEKMEKQYRNETVADIDCIELDNTLQSTLKGKGYRLVHDNFLTFNGQKRYDLIIMNPPFDSGDKHLLKALQLQENGGNIICLLNAETLKNPFSVYRKDLKRKLEELSASIEFLENEFVNAERKTNVEIALVKVSVPKREVNSKLFEKIKEDKPQHYFEEEIGSVSKYGVNDFVEMIVEQYETEIRLGISLIKEAYAFEKFSLDNKGELKLLVAFENKSYSKQEENINTTINNFIREVRGKYWFKLFGNDSFTGQLTTSLKRTYLDEVEKLKDYEFSIFNILQIQEDMRTKTIQGVEDEILKLFDEFSNKYNYSEYSKNIHLYNGWKTNKAWKINDRVIIPLNAFDGYWGFSLWNVLYKINDIVKVFTYLDNKQTHNINIREILENSEKDNRYSKIDFHYFTVTFYKKGTTHIEFLDKTLLKKFNIFGAQKRNWLPPTYGRAKYEDMTQEEKEVVKDFDTSIEEYNKVLQNKEHYLMETKLLLHFN